MSTNEDAIQEKKAPTVKVRVSSDKLIAYLTVGLPDNCREVTVEDLMSVLEEQQITYGVNEEEMKRRVHFQSFFNEFECAQGVAPVDGEDGTMEYLFDKDPVPTPTVTEDGDTDFHDMGVVQNVVEGQVLCRRTAPVPGKNGINVYGAEVPFKPGKECKFESGKNTVMSEDELELLSAVEGHVFYKNRKVEVNDVYTIRGNIDHSTGDIVSNGSVNVVGDVCEGYKIHAKGDVTVNGLVEGATIWAGGNVKITQGMNGMNIGKIYCGGNVASKFFQNAEVYCAGDVTAEYYLNGEVKVGGNIYADGNRGMMLGGVYEAGETIVAKTIGADTYLATKVNIVTNAEGFWDPEQQKSDEEILEELKHMSEEDREQWLAEHVYVAPAAPDNAKIVAKGIIYPGVTVTFGQWSLKIEDEYSNTRFYYSHDDESITNAPA